jgi:hypothetical protein
MHIHNPDFGNNENSNRIYAACGRVALHWGRVELVLEHLILKLRWHQNHQNHDGRKYHDFPVSFSKKVREIKDRLKDDDDYSQINDSFRALLQEAKTIHELRVCLVHSICQGINVDGKIIFGKSNQRKGVAYTERLISEEEISMAAQRMPIIAAEMQMLIASVNNTRQE